VRFREPSALYAAYRGGRGSPLPELAVQYAGCAVWQREQLTGEVLERQQGGAGPRTSARLGGHVRSAIREVQRHLARTPATRAVDREHAGPFDR